MFAGLKYCDVGSHLPTEETRADVISRLKNMKRYVNHSLPKKDDVLFTHLETKQAQHSLPEEPRKTIFSRLENKASPVTH